MTGYSDVADTYLEHGFQPFPTRQKRIIPTGATGRKGSVTREKIADWKRNGFRYLADPATKEWRTQDPATANTALRASELEVRIDVDAYGEKMGAEQLDDLERRLGPLPATPSSTARGLDSPARQYFFLLHEPVDLIGKAADDIDVIQYRHRYSLVAPSWNEDAQAHYAWYDAEGAPMDAPPRIEDLEYLPEAWVDYLRLPDGEHSHSGDQYDGAIPDVASPEEDRKLRTIVGMLQDLPDVWVSGSGWHDTVVRAAGWLARIARSNAYALTFEAARELLFAHTPVDASQGGHADLEQQWQSMVKATEGQYEEPPAPPMRPLLPWTGFPSHLPYPDVNGQLFALVWAHTPAPEKRAEHRRALMDALFAAGVNETEVATLVWHSGANKAEPVNFGGLLIEDAHAKATTLDQLWADVDAAQRAQQAPPTAGEAPAVAVAEMPAPIVVDQPALRPAFVTDAERAYILTLEWWGQRFLDWAQMTFASVNLPYYRMNRWTVLSIIFGGKAVLPRPGANDRPLNLYQVIVGRTTSGKSEALRAIKHILQAYFAASDGPDIGGNHTNESLPRVLIEKDGKATWFHLDEAHTKIPTWRKPNSYASEIPGILTDVYDGEVGARFRNTDKDNEGKAARAFMTVHLMGTPTGMADVMGPDDWESGFLNRFIWAIGDAPIDTIESMAGDWIEEGDLDEDTAAVSSGKEMYQQWGAEFSDAVLRIQPSGGEIARMRLPREVIHRHRQFVGDLANIGRTGPYADRLRPTFKRLNETVLRCAALVALSGGRRRIELGDLLIAIEQAEEWVANILVMVEATDESLRTRQVNALERAVLDRGGVMPLQEIHRHPRFKDRRRDTNDLIEELCAQGRAAWMDGTKTTLIAKGAVTGG